MFEARQTAQPLPSFRSEYRQRYPGYRTPSPPRRLIEPISPLAAAFDLQPSYTGNPSSRKRPYHFVDHGALDGTDEPDAHEWKPKGRPDRYKPQPGPALGHHRKASQPDSTALEFLATVATSPSLAPRELNGSFQYTSSASVFAADPPFARPQPFERASKRSRSEVINPRPIFSNNARPSTSYAYPSAFVPSSPPTSIVDQTLNGYGGYHTARRQSFQTAEDDVREDAELLLSISRGFLPDRLRDEHHMTSTAGPQDSHWDGMSKRRQSYDNYEGWPKTIYSGDEEKAWPIRQDVPLRKQAFDEKDAPISAAMSQQHTHNRSADGNHHQTVPIKPKDHRGWPKGKPRGPRNADAKKRSKTMKRNDEYVQYQSASMAKPKDPQLKKATETISPQETEWNMILDDLSESRRPRSSSDAGRTRQELWPVSPADTKDARSGSAPPSLSLSMSGSLKSGAKRPKPKRVQPVDVCKACKQNRNAEGGLLDHWISCNGCKNWFHIQCAGFPDEKKVKEIDKYYCDDCEADHGPTTYVRKSSRAHASVDYAGLHEGKIRTAVDVPDHHYIEPIKNGALEFLPETFARLPPELVTRENLERCDGWSEPMIIPASLNPRPHPSTEQHSSPEPSQAGHAQACTQDDDFTEEYEYDCVPDDGQDKLDMVIPHGLTVRRVAELFGEDQKLDVINVKNQEGEDKRWTMRQWADYYEAEGSKPVRNVISLEVSQSLLGKIIRRPKVVRDLDLQDSVWPEEETAKGNIPRVQFYCLMSVADCYTDFHIDFGGSSVYYHILKGRKTFFFIPPKPKYLKKYEEWCNSPDQNSVFLGKETKECYRVDLYPGDTMLIPSGWIHAVWTPENSLVIGGNFLTRMHYGTQIAVHEIEKATNVTRKFRYPHFQKILWLTVVRYLEQDPIPSTVVDWLCEGRHFERKHPIYQDSLDEEDDSGFEETPPELFNARYYSQAELEGLPDLIRYIYRTVMIALGRLPGITKTTQEAVTKSMPKDCGDHLEALRTFAMWTAWKRGNEKIPSWAYPDAPLAEIDATAAEKKVSAAAQKRLDRQAMQDALSAAGARRTSLRAPKPDDAPEAKPPAVTYGNESPKSGTKLIDSRRMACDSCRKGKRRCTHNGIGGPAEEAPLSPSGPSTALPRFGVKIIKPTELPMPEPVTPTKQEPGMELSLSLVPPGPSQLVGVFVPSPPQARSKPALLDDRQSVAVNAVAPSSTPHMLPPLGHLPAPNTALVSETQKLPKSRACEACRKSKHRCTHNGNGSPSAQRSGSSSAVKRPNETFNVQQAGAKKARIDPDTVADTIEQQKEPTATAKPQWHSRADHLAMNDLQAAAAAGSTSAASVTNGIASMLLPAQTSQLQPQQQAQQPQAPFRVPLNSISAHPPYQYSSTPSIAAFTAPPPSIAGVSEPQPPNVEGASQLETKSQLVNGAVTSESQASSLNGEPEAQSGKLDPINNVNRTSSNSVSNTESRSRTSSVHMQAVASSEEHSPPTSPLTDPMPSSPVQATLELPQTATPVPNANDNPSTLPIDGRASRTPSAGKANGIPTTPITPATARRSSTVSAEKSNWIKNNGGSRSGSGGSRQPSAGSPGAAGSPPREKTQAELEEEESVRVAMELAKADAGLRRRGVMKYTR